MDCIFISVVSVLVVEYGEERQMNVLVLTNTDHEEFVYKVAGKYGHQHLIIVLNNKQDFIDFTKSFSYSIGVSFMYLHKVPKEQIDTHTWINFHPAPLPEYRGRNLCYHAIMNGEKEFGATIHYMDENFDTGDIIEVFKFSICDDYTANDVSTLSIKFSEQLFSEYFPRILAGEEFPRIPNVGGKYYKRSVIMDTLEFKHDAPFSRFVRAITYGDFVPRIIIGGLIYKIVKDE